MIAYHLFLGLLFSSKLLQCYLYQCEIESKKWKCSAWNTKASDYKHSYFWCFFLIQIAEFDEDRRLDLIREEILKHRQEVLEQEKKLDSLLALLDPNVSDYSDMDAET